VSASSVLGSNNTVFGSKILVFSKANALFAAQCPSATRGDVAQDRAKAALIGGAALVASNISSARKMR